MFRVKVDGDSPLAKGVGGTAWNFTSYDLVMKAPSGVAVSYPEVDSPDAILGPDPAEAAEATATAKAVQEAAALPSYESPIRVSVKAADAAKAASVLRSVGATWSRSRAGGVVHYVIDNPRGLPVDHHPFAGRLPSLIRKAGIDPVAVALP